MTANKKITVKYRHKSEVLTVGFEAWKPFFQNKKNYQPLIQGVPHYLAVAVDAQIEKIMLQSKGW